MKRVEGMHRLLAMAASLASTVLIMACATNGTSAKREQPLPAITIVAPTPSSPVATPTTQGGQEPVQKRYASPPAMTIDLTKRYTATIKTTLGDIEVQLLVGDAPVTVNNFVFLARDGFYDNVPFHRIIKGFMIQTGDPTGTGLGGPGYTFKDEPVTGDYTPGTVAMANAGPNTNGSQFFIMDGDYSNRLPKNYTIFGRVTNGMDIVHQIAAVPVRPNAQGERSAPTQDVRIISVTIQEG